jgi:DNA-binding IclR family transcriptional regulator
LSNENSPKYHVPALEKGLDILETLAASPTPLSLTDLSNKLNRTRNELFRMLNYLEARGYIIKEEATGYYSLSLKMFELAHKHSPIKKLLSHALPYMEQFAQETRESCHLAVLEKDEIVILDQVLSPDIFRFVIQVGSRQPVLHTVSGRLLLAYMHNDKRMALLSQNSHYQKLAASEHGLLEQKFSEILKQAYSYSENETHIGIRSVSVLVGNPDIGIVAAFGIASLTFAKDFRDMTQLIQIMQMVAAKITSSMGLDYNRR